MFRFLRNIRQSFLTENKFSKYLLYAVGEVLLVVIGILIALQVDTWNDHKKQQDRGVELLRGIRSDLLKDTVDIHSNILGYEWLIYSDSVLLNHLMSKKPLTVEMEFILQGLNSLDAKLDLYTNYYETLKQEGLSLITNTQIRDKISDLYGWWYPMTRTFENEREEFDHYKLLDPVLSPILEVDSMSISANRVTVSPETYERLLEDKNFHYKIFKARQMHQELLVRHLELRKLILDLVGDIDEELKSY
ncbi:MAG: DUF6090 family protein [Eudoraea sp.]|nr:DUF6090 family protein [Eudoraea sp.]